MVYLYFIITLLFFILILLLSKVVEWKWIFPFIFGFIFVMSSIIIGFPFNLTGKGNKYETPWNQSPIMETFTSFESEVLSMHTIKNNVLLEAPVIKQKPELPRGCEVTSLAMLLQHADLQVDKMTLAKQLKKDPTPYEKKNGIIYFGNPNDGFVGDMYSYNKPGLGVYHKPIQELAEQYLPGRIVNLTGKDFQELKRYLSNDLPVWVITNTTFKKLSASQFERWQTPSGPIDITYKEHSVLITGYDQDFIYLNDPLTGEKNKKTPITDFVESWVQMGSQAITYSPEFNDIFKE